MRFFAPQNLVQKTAPYTNQSSVSNPPKNWWILTSESKKWDEKTVDFSVFSDDLKEPTHRKSVDLSKHFPKTMSSEVSSFTHCRENYLITGVIRGVENPRSSVSTERSTQLAPVFTLPRKVLVLELPKLRVGLAFLPRRSENRASVIDSAVNIKNHEI